MFLQQLIVFCVLFSVSTSQGAYGPAITEGDEANSQEIVSPTEFENEPSSFLQVRTPSQRRREVQQIEDEADERREQRDLTGVVDANNGERLPSGIRKKSYGLPRTPLPEWLRTTRSFPVENGFIVDARSGHILKESDQAQSEFELNTNEGQFQPYSTSPPRTIELGTGRQAGPGSNYPNVWIDSNQDGEIRRRH